MKIDVPTVVPVECYTLIEELVRNAVLFGLNGGGIHTDEYQVLTYQRKFLYEYLEDRLEWKHGDTAALLRFR